jgi:16S rRNA (guanine527-N7)-methyltransferase
MSSPDPLPPAPDFAARMLGADTLRRLAAFGELLATEGVLRGLIGPREVPRLWDRHLLNCAAVAEVIPPNVRVADIGTGAGLPGLVLALVRPDLELILVEPLQRRCDFLLEAVAQLGLRAQVRVARGRADAVPPAHADVVTSRAVAALDKLAPWCFPHARIGGLLLAMKGERAEDELTAARPVLRRWGADTDATIVTCGDRWLSPPVRLIRAPRRR